MKCKKRMRLPNGFGSITRVTKKNLRRPYYARVTVAKNEEGKPILKALKPAYYATYNEAYAALVKYHENPYELKPDLTVKELYKKWSAEYFQNITKTATRTVESAWAYSSALYDMKVKDVRARHIKYVIDHGTRTVKGVTKTTTPNMKGRIKSLFNLMLDYAVEYEIITVNYARTFNLDDKEIRDVKTMHNAHMIFTPDERKILWAKQDLPFVDMILIQSYSGWRPQELCKIRKEDVNFKDWTFTGGMKTQAGTHRTVPIHPCIRDLVIRRYKSSHTEYLFNDENGKPMTYDKYRHRFDKIIEELGLDTNHRPHDPRKTFITMCKNSGVDEYAIKKMAGHNISDITEAVYTVRPATFLGEELSKVSK